MPRPACVLSKSYLGFGCPLHSADIECPDRPVYQVSLIWALVVPLHSADSECQDQSMYQVKSYLGFGCPLTFC